ncbi:BZ3500_MvSof-1268-A1-R1_Chr12-2g03825 [Microbotryum saponariae]|uniref:BZ3500_MvSof-1268-A1-R1_Chr12-2g03825 protein n=1 Tax=Microbotryum saponariae TaxID=289078 RepID=A0A2X0L6B9_9BASI|nr:BZ3500_MvSof-1268-A1-R1_Chr12-2g03825 [Microbotryum saponariae]
MMSTNRPFSLKDADNERVGRPELFSRQIGLELATPEAVVVEALQRIRDKFSQELAAACSIATDSTIPFNTSSLNVNPRVVYTHHQLVTLHAADSVENEDESLFSIEYLQSFNIAGMPLHAAKFKVGYPVMLLRNLEPAAGLCNGTRLLLTRLHTRVLEAIIRTGDHAGQPVMLPRITLKTGSSAELPFTLHRTQFPIRLAMAMTFNKLQGPSLAQVGVCLETPVFSHGQVAAVKRSTLDAGLDDGLSPSWGSQRTKKVVQ